MSTPDPSNSALRASDQVCKNALEAEYVARSGDGIAPAKDESVNTRPQRLQGKTKHDDVG